MIKLVTYRHSGLALGIGSDIMEFSHYMFGPGYKLLTLNIHFIKWTISLRIRIDK